MATYLEMAAEMVAKVFASRTMVGIIRQGRYTRVIPPTPGTAGWTMESPTIRVLLYQFTGQGPMADSLWKPKDRIAMIQQRDLSVFGEPQDKDHLVIFPLQDAGAETHYQVVRGWEAAPSLMWHLQVRN